MNKKRTPTASIRAVLSKIPNYIVLILALVLSLSLFRNAASVKNAERMISEKETEVARAEEEQARLQDELEQVRSQEYIEKQLRDKLGLAKEGDIVVVLPPPEVLRTFAPKRSEEEEKLPDPNWKKWFELFI